MTRPRWMLILVACCVTLSFLTLEVNCSLSENAQLRLQRYQDPCINPHICHNTSNCGHQVLNRARPPGFNYSIEHVTSLVNEFRMALMTYTDLIQEAQSVLEGAGMVAPVPYWGLRNLYPLHMDTDVLAGSHAADEHRILRESRWLLTAVEAHVRVLAGANVIGAETRSELDNKIIQVSRRLTELLKAFSVTDLPARATCAGYPRGQIIFPIRVQFTSMVLRDVTRALGRISNTLVNCSVQNHTTGRHRVKLHCDSNLDSVFYRTEPSDIVYWRHLSSFIVH